jgi:ribonuclease G
MRFLVRLWGSLRERIALAGAPALVHADLPLAMRTLRDLVQPRSREDPHRLDGKFRAPA